MAAAQRPRFYFSFRSPYSWIAARLFDDHVAPHCDDVELIPFWEPDDHTVELLRARRAEFVYTPMSRAKHLYILQDVRRLTTRLGYKMTWPVDRDPWWELPHLGYLAARRAGCERAFYDAVYRARWEDGRDICSVDVIRSIAELCGADPDAIAGAPGDADVRAEGADCLARCYRDGVFGVPFFVSGYDKFWGVDRLRDFAAALGVEVAADLGAPAPRRDDAAGGDDGSDARGEQRASDLGHAGGCG